jgi:hypothetical protein
VDWIKSFCHGSSNRAKAAEPLGAVADSCGAAQPLNQQALKATNIVVVIVRHWFIQRELFEKISFN